jgi:hypothetical protein
MVDYQKVNEVIKKNKKKKKKKSKFTGMVFVKLLVLHLNHFDGNNALATNGKL